jgi:hypothetical protein
MASLRSLALCLASFLPVSVLQAQGAVVGSVYDSTAMHALDGAVVQLVSRDDPVHGKTFAALADGTGAFRIAAVPPGDYLLTFYDGRLDALALSASPRPVHVEGSEVAVELTIPGARTVTALHCGVLDPADSSAAIIGRLTRASDDTPVAGATIRAQWFELSFGSKQGLVRSTPTARALSDENGRFTLCGLPGDASVDLWASSERVSTGTIRIDLAPSALVVQELSLDPEARVSSEEPDARAARGSARLSGIVRDPAGAPLAGARVGLRNSDVESVTDDAGHYALNELPAGTQSVVVRAIGYVPVARPISLLPARAATLDVRFDSATVVLQTVAVIGRVVFDRATLEFQRAQARGIGTFIDRSRIDEIQPYDPSDILLRVPGVHVALGSNVGAARAITVNGPRGYCQPQYVIDGIPVPGELYDLDNFVRTEEIAGIAVYRGIETPMEYRVNGGDCGAIAIWTRRAGRKARR